MDTLREQTNEKMIAVAIKAAETIGVLAEGMGTEFKGCALKGLLFVRMASLTTLS